MYKNIRDIPKNETDIRSIILKSLEARKYIDPEFPECWRYNGPHNKDGYGQMSLLDKTYGIHRLSLYAHTNNFDLSNREIKALHKPECKCRDCWNPEHLYSGNQTSNMLDMSLKVQSQENFKCGHPRSIENTGKVFRRTRPGIDFYCKKCDSDRHKK